MLNVKLLRVVCCRPNSVCDVAVPRGGFARLRWKVHLHEAVPLGKGKHVGVNSARRSGERGRKEICATIHLRVL